MPAMPETVTVASERGEGDEGGTRDAGDEGGEEERRRDVKLGAVTVTGKLSPEDVQLALSGPMLKLRECFGETPDASARPAAKGGTMRVRLVVAASGKVSQANVAANSSFRSGRVEKCVLTGLKQIPFPKRPANTEVGFPFLVGSI